MELQFLFPTFFLHGELFPLFTCEVVRLLSYFFAYRFIGENHTIHRARRPRPKEAVVQHFQDKGRL